MFRIKSYGDASYFRKNESAANNVAKDIIRKNGCGFIEQQLENGQWQMISRFEPYYGIVSV